MKTSFRILHHIVLMPCEMNHFKRTLNLRPNVCFLIVTFLSYIVCILYSVRKCTYNNGYIAHCWRDYVNSHRGMN